MPTKLSEDAELLETFTRQHLDRELEQRNKTHFSGELVVKLVYRSGHLAECHIDDHLRVTGEALRGRPA